MPTVKYSRPKGFKASAWLALVALLLGAAGLFASPASHAAATTFDHFTTGFDLIGMHKSVPCESCHVGGIFKGTPTDCFSCHAAGSRIGASAKPTNHILSSNDCAQCHTPFGWRPVAKFNHLNVLGTCSSCHNNVQTVGKPTNHIPTTAECSTCHLVQLPWKAARYDHAGIVDNCARCHDNVHAPGKPSTHVPTTDGCETCHMWQAPVSANYVTFAGTPMNHVGIVNNCQACHETGMNFYGLKMVDRPTPAQDSFHPLATDVSGADCANCHAGFNVGDFNKAIKPPNHIPTKPGAQCKSCHDLTNLALMGTLGAIHANAPSSTTNCQQCHGSNASTFDLPKINFHIVGLPTNHLPTTVSCEVCHAGPGSSFPAVPVQDGAKFTNSLMNHAGSTTCDGCHGPSVAPGGFIGIAKIIVMPPTSPVGMTSHIPSNNSCENCHIGSMPSGYSAASSMATVPGSAFATPIPNTNQIHTGMKTGCTACHEKDSSWMGMDKYPIAPTVFIVTTQYTGFQVRPYGTPTTYSILDAAHPTGGDCVQCHGANFQYFDSQVKPDNHIPTSTSATCANCHNVGDFAQIPTIANIHQYAPSQTTNCVQCHGTSQAASFAIPAANFKITSMALVVSSGASVKHMPTTQSCEVCHVGTGSSVPTTVQDTSRFAASLMSHANVTTCVECHGSSITSSSFTGISKIIVMPPTTPAGASTAHIASGTACEICHQGSTPATVVAANSTSPLPGSKFATPIPSTAQIHSGISSGCQACHEGGYTWMGTSVYPLAPGTLSSDPTTQYMGFQTRPGAAGSTFAIKDAGHPGASSGDCESCHGTNINYFDAKVKPANHIPYASAAGCTACHTSSDFSALPTLTNIHANAQSTTTNCVQCHGTTQAAGFAIPAANFKITTMAALASGAAIKHMPTTQPCEVCHVGTGSSIASTVLNGALFAKSTMSHAGVTTCVECHGATITGSSFTGISKIVVMPPTTPAGAATAHIPTSTACETCHVGSVPTARVAASATLSAPGTKFATPIPSTAQIHSGVSSGCSACHEAPYAWMDMAKYPLSPATLSTNTATQYLGFQTRPGATAGTYIVKDAQHPGSSSGDCVLCHGTNTNYFAGSIKPANHIPYLASAACTNCHTNPDFSVMPTLANVHQYAQSTTTNCVQCHGTTQAAGFAIPAANFKITTMAALASGGAVVHMATSQSCEVCHVGAASSVSGTVQNGALFAKSAMSHTGITTCVSCHGPTITGSSFTGISKIIVMPPTTPAGAATAHIPSSTACETCHLSSMPSSQVAGNATLPVPGSLFATPVPSTAQIHSGVTTGCSACHEAPYAWMGMAKYPLSPATVSTNASTQYLGFQTRPGATAGTYIIQDAAHPGSGSGDCVVCHGTNTNYFSGSVAPANHIPYATAATCGNCHTSTTYSVMPTLTNIHQYAQSQTTNCVQCHGTTQAAGFAIPAANFKITTMALTAGGKSVTHVTTTASCEVCHMGAGSSVTGTVVDTSLFSGSKMSHTGITTCVSCHGPTITGSSFTGISKIIVMPATTPAGSASAHIPSSTACETCHLGSMPSSPVAATATLPVPGSLFATPVPSTAQIHTGVATGCVNCHEAPYAWMGMTNYPIVPATLSATTTTQYTGFQTRPGKAASTYVVADAAHPTTGDCYTCHGTGFTYFSGQAEPANHIPTLTGAACATCHTTAGNYAVYTTNMTTLHTAVATTCSTCHADGKGPFAGVSGFKIVQTSTRGLHIPITNAGVPVECSGCHKVVTAFTGTIMSHGAIGDSGSTAAGNACDACHESGFTSKFFGVTINFTRDQKSPTHELCGAPGTPTAPNITNCGASGGSDCLMGCHQHSSIPSKYARTPRPRVAATPAANAPPRVTPPANAGAGLLRRGVLGVGAIERGAAASGAAGIGAAFDHANASPGSCAGCHNGTAATGPGPSHPKTTSACADCHSTLAWTPVLRVDHADVLGACASCHNGRAAKGKPVGHLTSGNDCDRCHTTSAWKPASFDHSGVIAGTCASCHNGLQAVTKSASHVLTTLSCDTCHYVLGWSPVKPPVPPARRMTPLPQPRTPATPRGRPTTAPTSPIRQQ